MELALRNITAARSNFELAFGKHTVDIAQYAIGYGAKLVKGGVFGCPDLPTEKLIGYNAKNRL